jgi:peptidoglycan/LPS O-acetylase OafA/YrhL
MTQVWATALRRGSVPLVLGVLCWLASIPAIEDLDTLFKGLAGIFIVLGLVIVVATGRTLAAEERRRNSASFTGRPVKQSLEG